MGWLLVTKLDRLEIEETPGNAEIARRLGVHRSNVGRVLALGV